MNIQVIEQKSGLDRANVRFYEREGLISPKRLENGYRDYSEDDLSLLLKIKLLRKLGISLETIRSIINGETELNKVLNDRLAQLSSLRREIDAAEHICTQIRENGVSFSGLDAGYYLKLFENYFNSPGVAQKVLEKDRDPAPGCPWRRAFARTLDLCIISTIVYSLLAVIFRITFLFPSNATRLLQLIIPYACWAILLFYETVFISKFGATPGKAILGIRVEHADGRRLTFDEAFSRSKCVFGRGYGYNLPVYSVIRAWKSYAEIGEGKVPEWDIDCAVTVKAIKWHRPVIYIASYLLCLFLTVLAAFSPYIPSNRGSTLTTEEFVENYNQLARFTNTYVSKDTKLLNNGTFYKPEGFDGLELYDLLLEDDEPVILDFETENNVLTKVSYKRNVSGTVWDFEGAQALSLSVMAYAYSEANVFEVIQNFSRIPSEINLVTAESFDQNILGCRVTCDIDSVKRSETDDWREDVFEVNFSISR